MTTSWLVLAIGVLVHLQASDVDLFGPARREIERRQFTEAARLAHAALPEVEKGHGAESLEAARGIGLMLTAAGEGGLIGGDIKTLADRSIEIHRKELGEFHPETLAVGRAFHRALIQQGRGAEALSAAQTQVDRLRANPTVPEAELAASLLDLGLALQNRSQPRPARPILEEALNLAGKVNPGTANPPLVEYLRALARVQEGLGDVARATASAERARESSRTAGTNTFEYARVLADLSRLKSRSRAFDEAESLARESMAIVSGLYGPEHVDTELGLSALAWRHLSSGRPRDAVETNTRAAHLVETHLGPASIRLMIVLSNLARAHGRDGDLETARAAFVRSQAINASLASPLPGHSADMLQQIGNVDGQLGRLADAFASFTAAHDALLEVFGPDSPQMASILDRLSTTALVLNKPDEAQRHAERALAILLAQQPRNEERVTYARLTVARAARARKDPLARTLLEECLEARKKLQGPDSLEVAAVEVELSDLALEEERFADAAAHASRAAAVYRVRTPRHHQLDDAEEVMAIGAGRLGRWEEAVRLAEGVVTRTKEVTGPSSVGYGNAERLMASALAGAGREDEALDAALRAERVRLATVALASRHLNDSEALAFLATRRSTRSLALLLARARPLRAAEVLDVASRSRALVLDGLASRHLASLRAGDPEIRALQQEVSVARGLYATLAVSLGSGDAGRDRRELEEARERKETAERALALKSPVFRAQETAAQTSLPEVLATLPAGAVLVSFFETWPEAEALPPLIKRRDGDRRYVAFVSGRDGVERVLDLGEARLIDGLIAERLRAQRQFATDPSRRRRQAERRDFELGRKLTELLWDPIAPAIGVRRTVFIVPDGALSAVNLMSLVARNGRFLVESGWTFHVLPTERDLLAKPDLSAPGGFVAVGAPDFGGSRTVAGGAPPAQARSQSNECAARNFASLPSAREETSAVLRSLRPEQRRRALVLTGAAATEEALKALKQAPEVLHLATHSFSAPSCAAAAGLSDLDRLRLSGIALSGANAGRKTNAEGASEDGILTGEEAASLDLNGTSWVVLSACDSTGTESAPGEGLLGIRRSFQAAGARTVISSLWAIEDDSTARFMALLYEERFRRGRTTIAAMNAAIRRTLGERRREGESVHPLFWAGIVASGDWR